MKRGIILFALLMVCMRLYAQPGQLPSLLDGNDPLTPILPETEKPDEIIRKNVFVRAIASKKSVYVGEPLMVDYKLFTALNNRARVSRQPYFGGCSVLELSSERDPSEVMLNGKDFHVFTIRKVQITPLQEGTLQLGQAYVDNVISLIHSDGSGIENFSATLCNDPLEVEVKALPTASKPQNFSSLVGNFTIDAKVDTNLIPAGEDLTLSVTIKGTGNITGISMPTIHWPKGTEHFDGTDSQRIEQDNFPVEGCKTFMIPFIGNSEGSIEIPPISFSYFDASTGAYKTIETKSIPVTFTKAVSRNDQMKHIVTEEVTNRKYLWIVGAIGATVVLVFSVGMVKDIQKARQQKQKAVAVKEEPVIVKDKTSEIFTELNELGSATADKDFLSKTKSFLTKTLQVKLATEEVAEQELIAMMKKNHEYMLITPQCEHIFEICNRNLYSPDTDENVQELLYFELTSVVKKIYNFS